MTDFFTMKDLLRDIGRRIRSFRKSRGMDQASFAALIGASNRETISRWERGLSSPDAELLANMHKEFDCDIEWLVTGKQQTKKESECVCSPLQLEKRLGDNLFMFKEDLVFDVELMGFILGEGFKSLKGWEEIEEKHRSDILLLVLVLCQKATLEELGAIQHILSAFLRRKLNDDADQEV